MGYCLKRAHCHTPTSCLLARQQHNLKLYFELYGTQFWLVSCIMCQFGLAVRGHVGMATQASGVLFITPRGTCVRAHAGSSQSNVISR